MTSFVTPTAGALGAAPARPCLRPRISAAAFSLAVSLAGCASFSPDGGFDKVDALTKERTGQSASWQRDAAATDSAKVRVAELLKQPLTADTSVEIALLGNRGLQAAFGELGIAESDLVRAGRLANPGLSFGHIEGGGITEIDRSLMFNVLGLLTMPLATQLEQRRFEQAQYLAAYDAVSVAAQARKAFYAAVAAQDLVNYYEQVQDAADASAELARRMLQAGNFNKLAQMRQEAFYADAVSELSRARHRATAERERLVRVLGLSTDQLAFKLPERLPDLPDAPTEPHDAEQTAMNRRLDVLMARRSTEATARSLGLTRATRFVNVLDLGYANKSRTGEPRQSGYRIDLELPLFDFGDSRMVRAEMLYRQSMDRTKEVAVNAQSEVREALSAYRSSYDIARHYRDDVVPLRKRISDENQLRYNGMLISVFELLADSREQIAGVTGYVEALRDYWLADVDLQTAISGRSPAPGAMPGPKGTR